MKRIIYVLGVLLLLSLSLNVFYEHKTHKFRKKIHNIITQSSKGIPSETILATYNNKPVDAFNGFYNQEVDSTISMIFLGNSITYHLPWENVGEQNPRGMAATKLEKDYVHQLLHLIADAYKVNIKYSIFNIAQLERGFAIYDFNLDSCFCMLEITKPDILILQIGENVSKNDVEERPDKFKNIYGSIFDYYPNCHKFVTLPFWLRKDENYLIVEEATNHGAVVVDLSHLGSDPDKNYASSSTHYENAGIGMHPGDEGMLNIANCLFSAIRATIP